MTLARSEQTATITAALPATSFSWNQDVCHVGLWTRIWLQYHSALLAMSGEVSAAWSGGLADMRYAGNLGSPAALYNEKEPGFVDGTDIFLEMKLESAILLAGFSLKERNHMPSNHMI